MRWVKLGKIFNPADWDMGEGIVGYAQSPQALAFDDFVRIYFSTRKVSANGKFISVVRCIDYNLNQHKILRVTREDVLPPAALGAFDEHGIFPMNMLRVGKQVHAYIGGWSRRKSVDIDMAIGLAISRDDGETFERMGPGPVLTASPHEPFLVGDPFVQRYDGIYHMWYIFGTQWKLFPGSDAPERVYKIAHATSADGIEWVKEDGQAIIADALGENECQALPTVIKIGAQHHMFFCYRYASDFRKNPARGYRLGHATSVDLRQWVRDAALCLQPGPGQWDSDMICYPHVFEFKGDVYLLYNGNAFGRDGFGLARLEM